MSENIIDTLFCMIRRCLKIGNAPSGKGFFRQAKPVPERSYSIAFPIVRSRCGGEVYEKFPYSGWESSGGPTERDRVRRSFWPPDPVLSVSGGGERGLHYMTGYAKIILLPSLKLGSNMRYVIRRREKRLK